jgi:hypothetical protein
MRGTKQKREGKKMTRGHKAIIAAIEPAVVARQKVGQPTRETLSAGAGAAAAAAGAAGACGAGRALLIATSVKEGRREEDEVDTRTPSTTPVYSYEYKRSKKEPR